MYLLTEPFMSAEVDYRRERAMAGRRGLLMPRPHRKVRQHRTRALVHRLATGL